MPIPAGDDGALLTLADAKAQLNMRTSLDDDELLYYIAAATREIERRAGAVVPRAVTEVVRQRGGRTLMLATRPVLSVTSATALNGGTLDVSALYVASPKAGLVRRTDDGLISGGPWTVVYQAGRDGIPENIGLAARMLVQHLWETQRGGATLTAPRMDVSDTEGYPGLWFAVPNKVKELLEGELVQVMAY